MGNEEKELDPKALEAAQIAMRGVNVCGLTTDGKYVFCDDPLLDGKNDGYGYPLRHAECECRLNAERVVRAFLAALLHEGQG